MSQTFDRIFKHILHRLQGLFGVAEGRVEFNDVKRDQLVVEKGTADNFHNLLGIQAIFDSCSRATNQLWIQRVHVKADVDRSVGVSDVFDGVRDVQDADLLLFDDLGLEVVDVSNTTVR